MSGQVLTREKNEWRKIDRGIRGRFNLDFEDIAGNSEKDLYAVSTDGRFYHYDGSKWTRIKIKNERPLSGITKVSKRDFLICGDEGVLILGSDQQWEILEVGKWNRANFWSVEIFKKTQDFHRLHASQKFLYSFGTSRILKFDGKKWTEVKFKVGKTTSCVLKYSGEKIPFDPSC